MKCIKKESDGSTVVIRTSNILAEILVRDYGWEYCPKELWKSYGRRYGRPQV